MAQRVIIPRIPLVYIIRVLVQIPHKLAANYGELPIRFAAQHTSLLYEEPVSNVLIAIPARV